MRRLLSIVQTPCNSQVNHNGPLHTLTYIASLAVAPAEVAQASFGTVQCHSLQLTMTTVLRSSASQKRETFDRRSAKLHAISFLWRNTSTVSLSPEQ